MVVSNRLEATEIVSDTPDDLKIPVVCVLRNVAAVHNMIVLAREYLSGFKRTPYMESIDSFTFKCSENSVVLLNKENTKVEAEDIFLSVGAFWFWFTVELEDESKVVFFEREED
jgi:hypothetical protein